jgi:short-subunit dehydrogenase
MTADTSIGAILITGCSSGIGRVTAIALYGSGLMVYASARNPADLEDVSARGIRTLALDVTDEPSMVAAVDTIESEAGAVGVLINNAGYGLYGSVEQLPMAEIRRQFETNFFGLVRLTQLVLPGMRRAGRGRIVNISSMGGRTTLPGGAFYHASKHAVESFSDALRMEVGQFGIDVVLIEPGPVRTPWNDVAAASVSGAVGTGSDQDPYSAYKSAVAASFTSVTRGPLVRFGSTAEDVANVITKAVTARRPRTRYLINGVARGMVAIKRWLPDRVHDAVLSRQYGLPR